MSVLNQSIDTETQRFSTPEEEIVFLKKKLEETQIEFLEFQESSRELEAEYETQVKQLEKKNNDYMNQLAKLDLENDQLKSKYSAYASDTQYKLNEYQEQSSELQGINTRLNSYIRELEQNNDDLERARRALAASLEDFEGQLNQQIEKNVLLENEVSEKEELECLVQRLKEETRDLKHELIVKSAETAKKRHQKKDDHAIHIGSPNSGNTDDWKDQPGQAENKSSLTPTTNIALANGQDQAQTSTVDSTDLTREQSYFSYPPNLPNTVLLESSAKSSKSQQISNPSSPTMPAMIMSPSSRVSALNIVSDLLRKVLSLESKLSAAKKVATN